MKAVSQKRPPQAVGHVAAELDGDAAQDERPHHHEDGQVEAGEARGEHLGKGQEQGAAAGQQPDLVAVPEGADGAQHLPALLVRAGHQQVQDARAEVEAVHDHVDGDHHADQPEPESFHAVSL